MNLLKPSIIAAPLLAVSLDAAAVSAPVLEIQFTGLDLVYAGGTTIEDSGDSVAGLLSPESVDALFSMDFILDGVLVEQFNYADGIFADVELNLAAPLVPDGSLVPILGGGVFNLYMPDGQALITNTLAGTGSAVSWIDNGFVSFVFAGGLSEVLSDSLMPSGLAYEDNLTVEFSFSLNNVEAVGDGFIGSGTGEFVGEVPVPAAAWLFGSALMALAGLKRKR